MVLVSGCATEGRAGSRAPAASSVVNRTLTVLAAASLTESFVELGRRFEERNPGVTVHFGFGASSTLARQVLDGAPADLVATADAASLDPLESDAQIVRRADFATNRLAIAVRPGNPDGIYGLADLGRRRLVVVLCAPEVPCGRLARDALDGAGVEPSPASLESDVKAVVARVALGEADAGIVYETDVASDSRVQRVALNPGQNRETRYPIAVLAGRGEEREATASAFMDYVLSPDGQASLTRFGFGPP